MTLLFSAAIDLVYWQINTRVCLDSRVPTFIFIFKLLTSKKENLRYRTEALDLHTIFDRNLIIRCCLILLYLLSCHKAQIFVSIFNLYCQTCFQSMRYLLNIYRGIRLDMHVVLQYNITQFILFLLTCANTKQKSKNKNNKSLYAER